MQRLVHSGIHKGEHLVFLKTGCDSIRSPSPFPHQQHSSTFLYEMDYSHEKHLVDKVFLDECSDNETNSSMEYDMSEALLGASSGDRSSSKHPSYIRSWIANNSYTIILSVSLFIIAVQSIYVFHAQRRSEARFVGPSK